jgi:hypothetical protein
MGVLNARGWRPVALATLAGLPLLWLALARLTPRQGLRFGNVRELKAWAEGRGLHCRSDWEDGRVTDGLAVSTRPLTWEQVGRLCRAAPGKGADWEGVLWAVNRASALEVVPTPPGDGECRVWGGILVTGDRHLLDRLEGEGP